MWLVGFDPGGKERFGWSVVEATEEYPLAVRRTGLADHAEGAVAQALGEIPGGMCPSGVGIDSPLFWTGCDRKVDQIVRGRIKELGARSPGGTVQNVNSLRGACVIQGILAARLVRNICSAVPMTESHPKALLWLMGVAKAKRPMANLRRFLHCEQLDALSEHERDATLGALGAWAMVSRPPDWKDLFPDESDPFVPFPPVAYWMPTPASAPG